MISFELPNFFYDITKNESTPSFQMQQSMQTETNGRQSVINSPSSLKIRKTTTPQCTAHLCLENSIQRQCTNTEMNK